MLKRYELQLKHPSLAVRPLVYDGLLGVDMLPQDPPVKDQGQLGSCTGNAIAAAREYVATNIEHRPYEPLSRLFLYWEERKLEHTVNRDAGAQIGDGMQVLQTLGVPPESLDPYDIATYRQPPSRAALAAATAYRVKQTHQLTDLAGILATMAAGYPVVLGIPVYASFEEPGPDGRIAMPRRGEPLLGGHAIKSSGYELVKGARGFDLTKSTIWIQNSWGTSWGLNGYCRLPLAYLQRYSFDAWTFTV